MYYHSGKKLVFLAQPHTGSHSVAYALLHHGFELGNNSVAVVGNELRRPYHHADLWEGGHVTPENRKDWTVFSTVRNHYDLVLSRAWKYANFDPNIDWKNAEDWFRKALQFNWWVKPTTLFGKFRPDSDRLLRYESLQRHLDQTVGGRVKLPQIHKNPARNGRPFQEFYTPYTRAMVEDRYKDEIEDLGYSWEDHWGVRH